MDEAVEDDPIARFLRQQAAAAVELQGEPGTMTLATTGADGRPSARLVLLRAVDARGFTFYSSYAGRKAIELAANPHAALVFYWPTTSSQVRVEGTVDRLPAADSEAYWTRRPRGSQLAARASRQSQPIASREALEAAWAAEAAAVGEGPVPRPADWGGYRLVPARIEFWSGRPDRLHDREVYTVAGDGWRRERLQP